ncbi:PREDICTED: FYN-binding protein [Acanthisitta chloris]|uniref:FYN-binding protein n=1 Tax=Acanthisitta chloris TaxID=57068 RepID=UPI0004F0C7F0|nr:PREDICTED: FYN-binding protein [Acanthisitta chloris]
MAKFEAGNIQKEDDSNGSQPIKIPTREIGIGIKERKAAFEKFASQGNVASSPGPSTSQKPVHPDPPLEVKPSTDDQTEKVPKPSQTKGVAQMFGVQLQATNRGKNRKTINSKIPSKISDPAKKDPKPSSSKCLGSSPPQKERKLDSNFEPQETKAKQAFSKVPQVNKPKLPLSKPPLAQKSSLTNEMSHNKDTSNKSDFLQRPASSRTNTCKFKEAKEMGENSNRAAETEGNRFRDIRVVPTSPQCSSSQGIPKNMEEKTAEKGISAVRNIFFKKITQEESDSSSLKLSKMKTPLIAGKPSGEPQKKEDGDGNSRDPVKKGLPPAFKLGQPPEKPNRPLTVDLERHQNSKQKNSESTLFSLSWVLSFWYT